MTYNFKCDQGVSLKAIETKLFDHFSGIMALRAQWKMNGKQGAATLIQRLQQINIR